MSIVLPLLFMVFILAPNFEYPYNANRRRVCFTHFQVIHHAGYHNYRYVIVLLYIFISFIIIEYIYYHNIFNYKNFYLPVALYIIDIIFLGDAIDRYLDHIRKSWQDYSWYAISCSSIFSGKLS